ncbi:CAP domain-containing protein [Lentzea kentuckyensis]|uniref:CAP domain-containing protein n=1 Tax=Lentzea kentuckyensis TaxID=360086 RepID=UPI000A3B46AF|nr:CAP domain-containing protein [Lentzea kentuckyensis]
MPGSHLPRRRTDSAGLFRPSPGRIDSAPALEPDVPDVPDVVRPALRSQAIQSDHEDNVLRLVNDVRKKAGLSPLSSDERLRAAARKHSKDMAARNFCTHVNPDGVTPSQRMSAAGYPSPGGENVACGQSNPHAVMTAWMNSPPHRANILNAEFRTLGVGVDLGRGGPYWTQNFGY